MKKWWIPLVILSVVLAILFIPIPRGTCNDGGTKEYIALTYKIVDWNHLYSDGTYQKTRVYFGSDRNKAIGDLWEQEQQYLEHKFVATVIEINGTSVLVEPVQGEEEQQKIQFDKSQLNPIEVTVGSVVEITYRGMIMETYPAQINATQWVISNDLRHMAYTEPWIDKTTAKKYDHRIFDHIKITKIYANCFFAKTVVPMPYEIKLNGKLSSDWCVGDQVECTYENTYYNSIQNRVEVDMLTIKASDWQPEPFASYKPVIYLYPEEETEVSVQLDLDGELTCTYPAYNSGWTVTASPDGTLTDRTGQTYNYLYWEGETNAVYDFSRGFCVKGENTAVFLERALEKLGLTRREANEFIVYWLPLMQNNPYNIISFQTDRYTEAAQLRVDPQPDTLIRVFMTWKSSDAYIKLEEQSLYAPERNGFTVVEWGGTEIK